MPKSIPLEFFLFCWTSPSSKKRDLMRMMNFNLKKQEELLKNLEINNYEMNIDIDNILINTVVEAKESFYSSTPKKDTECEECVNKSQCGTASLSTCSGGKWLPGLYLMAGHQTDCTCCFDAPKC